MSELVDDVLELIRLAGGLSRAGARPRGDCPYDPIDSPEARLAWLDGWDAVDLSLDVASFAREADGRA